MGVERFTWLYEKTKRDGNPNEDLIKMNLEAMKSHRDIIKDFGRFPHRNKIWRC